MKHVKTLLQAASVVLILVGLFGIYSELRLLNYQLSNQGNQSLHNAKTMFSSFSAEGDKVEITYPLVAVPKEMGLEAIPVVIVDSYLD